MKRTTFINKYASSGNVGCSTHEERKRINERNREFRRSGAANAFSSRYRVLRQVANPQPVEYARRPQTEATRASEAQPRLVQSFTNMVVVPKGPGHSADPFEVNRVPLNSSVLRLLRYYKDVYYTSLWNDIDTVLDGKIGGYEIIKCSPERVILECMESKSRMSCLLAVTGSHLAQKQLRNEEIAPFQLLQRGTVALRDELRSKGNTVDNDVLLDALHLYLATKFLEDERAVTVHLAGLKAIIAKMLEQSVAFSAPRAAMIALVEPELACKLLLRMSTGETQVMPSADPLADLSFETIEQILPGERP